MMKKFKKTLNILILEKQSRELVYAQALFLYIKNRYKCEIVGEMCVKNELLLKYNNICLR